MRIRSCVFLLSFAISEMAETSRDKDELTSCCSFCEVLSIRVFLRSGSAIIKAASPVLVVDEALGPVCRITSVGLDGTCDSKASIRENTDAVGGAAIASNTGWKL